MYILQFLTLSDYFSGPVSFQSPKSVSCDQQVTDVFLLLPKLCAHAILNRETTHCFKDGIQSDHASCAVRWLDQMYSVTSNCNEKSVRARWDGTSVLWCQGDCRAPTTKKFWHLIRQLGNLKRPPNCRAAHFPAGCETPQIIPSTPPWKSSFNRPGDRH